MKYKLLKEYLGVIILDFPRYFKYLNGNNLDWIFLCNRIDELLRYPTDVGVLCNWQWSRSLHAPQLFPFLGKMLMKKALREFSIEFAKSPSHNSSVEPDISFIIGHRGLQRLPHLLQTLQSIASQENIKFECLVVEQSSQPEVKEHLPAWVRYIHDPYENNAYNRSRTFNIGFSHAKGKLLVLHDNDMAVPTCYGQFLLQKFTEGYEVINLKRFIFYLSNLSTEMFFEEKINLDQATIDSIVQNLEAGGSIAIGREAYRSIGGFDEEFVGWGGEDLEFWERCLTRNVWNYTFLPIVHFWHYSQPEKNSKKDTAAMKLYRTKSLVNPLQRVEILVAQELLKN
jgi:GT2 family glycosyltransferase